LILVLIPLIALTSVINKLIARRMKQFLHSNHLIDIDLQKGFITDINELRSMSLLYPPSSKMQNFNIKDGVPGLQVTTKNSSQWTPVASRTRSKFKL